MQLTIEISDRAALQEARAMLDLIAKNLGFAPLGPLAGPRDWEPGNNPNPFGLDFADAVRAVLDDGKFGLGRRGYLLLCARAGDDGVSTRTLARKLFAGAHESVGATHRALEATWKAKKVRGDRWAHQLINTSADGRHVMIPEARDVVLANIDPNIIPPLVDDDFLE